MPRLPIDTLPDDARAWVFAAHDVLDTAAATRLLVNVDAWLDTWRAHGAPLVAARDLREARFLCIAVDERASGASGCSVDGLFRRLRDLESDLGTSLVGAGAVYWRDAEGVVVRSTRAQLAALAQQGVVDAATPVFDTTVTTLAGWRRAFERPAGTSWAARIVTPASDGAATT